MRQHVLHVKETEAVGSACENSQEAQALHTAAGSPGNSPPSCDGGGGGGYGWLDDSDASQTLALLNHAVQIVGLQLRHGTSFGSPHSDWLMVHSDDATTWRISLGAVTPDASPNGSARNIAGVFNARRNVLGMMPHPENAIDRRLGSTDGRRIFDALVEAVAR
jgi:hypothetical protein